MQHRSYINRDYKIRLTQDSYSFDSPSARKRVWRRSVVLIGLGLTGLLVFSLALQEGAVWKRLAGDPAAGTARMPISSPDHAQSEGNHAKGKNQVRRVTVPLDLPRKTDEAPSRAKATPPPVATSTEPRVVTVSKGDSLSRLFDRLSLPQTELLKVLASGEDAKLLRRLRPGQRLEFHLTPEKQLQRLIYRIDETAFLRIVRQSGKYRSELVKEKFEKRTATASGAIGNSLFISGQEAGLSDKLIMGLVDIFGWDIDFALDIRDGDRFTVLYEELFKHGEKIRDGEILAAEFINQRKVIRAVRYVNKKKRVDYFSPDGNSMRKAFLRTPVKFSRISSRFTHRRWHPVLHRFRAHKGVDYAAPTGTPVKATGDGKIKFVGRKGGLGKSVFIQHGGKYTTVYGHLSRYARVAKRGNRVRQGQTIGYVGSTGLATGPHLHYEFRVNGVHRNPLKVRLPQAAPINPEYRTDFLSKTQGLVAQLDVLSRLQLASNQ